MLDFGDFVFREGVEEVLGITDGDFDGRHAILANVEFRGIRGTVHLLKQPCLSLGGKRLFGGIDKLVAVLLGRPRDACLLNDGEMLQLDFAVLAHPCRRRCEFFKVFNGFDGAFLQRFCGVVFSESVIQLQLVVADIDNSVYLRLEFSRHASDLVA